MKIKIIRIEIRNFKGIKSFTIDLKGKNAEIIGENGTGKSTIADAWYWLISGRDGVQQANFEAFELTEDNNVVNMQNAVVIADLEIDRKPIQLKKEYKQVWTKKRGEAEKQFTRNTTDHFIDQVPVSKREYDNKVSSIIDEKLFRTLSDVRYFCSLPIDDRRKTLLEMTGQILPEDILTKHKDISGLDSILSERELEDYEKILKSRKAECNKQLDSIPDRVDENMLAIKEIDLTENEIKKQLEKINKDIQDTLIEKAAINTGKELSKIENEIADIKLKEKHLEIEYKSKNTEDIGSNLSQKSALVNEVVEIEQAIVRYAADIKTAEHKIKSLEEHKSIAIKAWKDINSRTLPEDDDICSECGQQLPDFMIADRVENFNSKKANDLKEINERGKNLSAEIKELNKRIEGTTAKIEKLKEVKEKKESNIKQLDKIIHDINNETNVEYSNKQIEYSRRLTELNDKIKNLKESIQPAIDELDTTLEGMQQERVLFESKLNSIEKNEQAKKRITELQEQLKEISKEYQNIEHELFLIEKYRKYEAQYVEDNVSEHFSITKWKLFEYQLNGGIRNVCEPCYNGVPYSTNTSNGERLLIGMDCINAISKHYDISVPVFIDNAESLTNWIDFKHQHITLSAVKGKKLEAKIL